MPAPARAQLKIRSRSEVPIIHSRVVGVFTAVGGDVDSPSVHGDRVGCGGANAAPGCHAAWCAMTGAGVARRGHGEVP